MPRHVVATLFIGLTVSAVLIGAYQTDAFYHVAWWVHGCYEETFLAVEPGLLLPLQFGVILLMAYAAAWVGVDTPSPGGRGVTALLGGLALVTLSPTLALYGQLFEPASGVAALLLGISAGSIYANSEPGKRRHLLRNLLGGRASPSLIRSLSESKFPLQLDSSTRPAAALTCRITNHEELASTLTPENLAAMTKRFHALTCDFLIERGGILDADSPDCTRSYFGLIGISDKKTTHRGPRRPAQQKASKKNRPTKNRKRGSRRRAKYPADPRTHNREKGEKAQAGKTAPEKDGDTGTGNKIPQGTAANTREELAAAAIDACQAALELAPHLRNLSRECETATGHRMVAGIGIECGALTTCLIDEGEGQRLGAVGTLADFTLRLSAANSTFGSDILIGPATLQAARDTIKVRPVEMLYNPHSNHLTEIYQLIDEKGLLSDEDNVRRHAYWEGVVLLRQNLPDDALEKFSRAKGGRRHDPPLAYFIEKANALRESRNSDGDAAPPAPHHARDTASF